MDLGAPELMIVLILALLLFGGAKLPQLARSLGEAQREFKKGLHEGLTDDKVAPLAVEKPPLSVETPKPD